MRLFDGLFASFLVLAPALTMGGSVQAADKGAGTTTVDPFLRYFQRSLRAPKLPFMVKEWGEKIVESSYEDASHLWAAIQKESPESYLPTARAAQLFVLWQVGLQQTFFNEWTLAVGDATFAKSDARAKLEQSLEIPVGDWLATHPLTLTKMQESTLLNNAPASWKRPFLAQTGETALKYLKSKPEDYNFETVERAVLHLALQKKVDAALETLEEYAPAAVGSKADLKTRHQMLKARLLYQAGAMRDSIKAYSQIDRDDPMYPTMVEERAWGLARAGDYDTLRGDLESLSKPLYKNYFGPEAVVLRSILELKLCHYENVKNTFDAFNDQFRPWAKKISDALAQSETPTPPWTDPQLKRSEVIQSRVAAEYSRLKKLEDESLSAPLTAVGRQSHWALYGRSVQDSLALAQKELQKNRARVWRQRGQQLSEAIRKMRFVKVELMSQLSLKMADNLDDSKSTKVAQVRSGLQVYPYEAGEVWPDELFRIRALSNTSCPTTGGAR